MPADRSKRLAYNFNALRKYINDYLEEKGYDQTKEPLTDEDVIRFMGYVEQLCYASASTREMTNLFTDGIPKKTRNSAKWVVPDLIMANSRDEPTADALKEDYELLDSTIDDYFGVGQEGDDEDEVHD